MTIAADPGGIVKAHVLAVSVDAARVDRNAAEAQGVDALCLPLTTIATLPAASDHCDAIVVFADGFEEDALAGQLRELSAGGPMLVVVTGHPQRWVPRVERGSAIVHDTSWRWGLVHALLRGPKVEDAESGPELPFTD
jgi:hypothetical protein